MDKNTLIKVINKYNGVVGYDVPDLGVHRNFYPNEQKDITFEELEKLSYTPGGDVILQQFLEVTDAAAIAAIFHTAPEPEYHYNKDDVKQVMVSGSLDQFLDLLDFAPEGVKEIVKDLAIELPLNDIAKRDAIREKLGFDVTKAIEIKNMKYDSDAESEAAAAAKTTRRTSPIKNDSATAAPSGRRYKPANKE